MKTHASLPAAGLLAAGLMAAIGLAAAQPAQAQTEAQTNPEPPAVTGDALVLEPVVVTATRVPAPARDLAGNTSVIDREAIELISHDTPAELLNRVPGVYIHANSGQEHLTAIRSPVLTGGAGQGSFLYLEDGIPLRAAGWGNVNGLFDAHFEEAGRVEVVRGPGSALYGSNAIHGLINVIPPAPAFSFEGAARAEAGPHRDKASFDVTGPLSETTAARAAVSVLEDSTFRQHADVGQQKATFSALHNMGPDRLKLLVSGQNLNQETAGFIRGFEAYKDRTLAHTNPNPEAFRDAWSLRASARFDHRLAEGATLSLTPFARVNDMEFLRHFVPDQSLEETGHWSTGVLAALYMDLDGGHRLVTGLDAEYTDGYLKEVQSRPTFGSFPQGVHYDFTVAQTVLAPYVHAEWQLDESTRLTTGLRLDWTHYDYDNRTDANTVGRFQRPADRTDTFFNVTPKLGVVHTLDGDTQLYANLARAARAPQVTDLYRLQVNQRVGEIESETLTSIEAGTRAKLGPVRVDLAGFYAYKENFFFRDADGFNVTDGETSHRGVELEAAADLPAGFDLALAATYAIHRYEFDRPITNPAQQTEAIRAGTDMDTAPRWLADARLGWAFAEGARAELEWQFVDKYFVDAANQNTYEGHQLFNLRLRAALTENVDLLGRVMNIGNVDYATRADFAFGSFRYFPGEPRSIYAGLAVSF